MLTACKGVGSSQPAVHSGYHSPRPRPPRYGRGALAGAPGPAMLDSPAANQSWVDGPFAGGPHPAPFAPPVAANAADYQVPQGNIRKIEAAFQVYARLNSV